MSTLGMVLRTHPDDGASVGSCGSRIMLVKADEIVMEDGTVTADWPQLVADVSINGVGGLDTGTVTSESWYDTYGIRKSSDGTRALLLHRHKNYAVDQSQQSGVSTIALRDNTARTMLAQSFTPTVTAAVEIVDIPIKRVGIPSGRIWFTIEADSSGSPSGTSLATSDKITIDGITGSAPPGFNLRGIFRLPAKLTQNVVYWLVMHGDYSVSASGYIHWYCDTTGTYSRGVAAQSDGSSWSSAGYDMAFKVYATMNDSAVVMPSGYDQKRLLGFFYTSTLFDPMIWNDRIASWGIRSTGNGPAGLEGFTCTTPLIRDSNVVFPHGISLVAKVWGMRTEPGRLICAAVPEGHSRAPSNFDNTATAKILVPGDYAYGGEISTEYGGVYVYLDSPGAGTVMVPTWVWT